MARAVRDAVPLACVYFVPAARNPLKPEPPTWPEEVRVAALRRLVASEPGLGVWEGELARPPPSYTWQTVDELAEQFPEAERWWIVGADSVASLPQWYRAAELVERIGFLGVARPGVDTAAAEATARAALPGLRLRWVSAPAVEVSSTEIRRRGAAGLSWREFLPPPVADGWPGEV